MLLKCVRAVAELALLYGAVLILAWGMPELCAALARAVR